MDYRPAAESFFILLHPEVSTGRRGPEPPKSSERILEVMKIYRSSDGDSGFLKGKKIVVLGYGNQGRPQALNLRDSGLEVTVAARSGGEGWKRAEEDGFDVVTPPKGASLADLLLLLVPDEKQGEVFQTSIRGKLRKGAFLCFAHGFSVAFDQVRTEDYVLVLVAPKGQGERVRESYLEGSGLPCLIGTRNDQEGEGMKAALAIASGLGCLRVGAFETTFREEAVSDMFGEQAVLCGGVTALVKSAFQTLVKRGFSPQVAYFECVHELKIIVDLFCSKGFAAMREMISGTAAYGGLKYGEKVIAEEAAAEMERLFSFIDEGGFAEDWLREAEKGGEDLGIMISEERDLLIEKVGEEVRKLFPEAGS